MGRSYSQGMIFEFMGDYYAGADISHVYRETWKDVYKFTVCTLFKAQKLTYSFDTSLSRDIAIKEFAELWRDSMQAK